MGFVGFVGFVEFVGFVGFIEFVGFVGFVGFQVRELVGWYVRTIVICDMWYVICDMWELVESPPFRCLVFGLSFIFSPT